MTKYQANILLLKIEFLKIVCTRKENFNITMYLVIFHTLLFVSQLIFFNLLLVMCVMSERNRHYVLLLLQRVYMPWSNMYGSISCLKILTSRARRVGHEHIIYLNCSVILMKR